MTDDGGDVSDSNGQNRTKIEPLTPLTGKRAKAALLVAGDQQSNETIATNVGIAPSTLALWKRQPLFAAHVDRICTETLAALKAEGIASKQNRIDLMVAEHDLLERIRAERAAHHAKHDADIPGADTGLLVRTIKIVGVGRDQQTVDEWVIDNTLINQRSALKRQVAQEKGEWTEKREVKGTVTFADVVALAGDGDDV